MEDSGTILAHISSLKEMLDQVNEEIEANIQITREIESSIVKCEEIESDLAAKEAELIKMSCMLQFDTVGYGAVAADFRASVSALEKELCCLKMKRDEIVNLMDVKREKFTALCLEFQIEIDKRENCKVRTLLSEKDSLENEIQLLEKKNNVLKNSVLAFVEEILEDLHSSNSALEDEIQRKNWENEKLLNDINDLKSTLLSAIGTTSDDLLGSGSKS
ncbi:GRIP domain-containing protein RUD3-like isoform X2 [Lotus japonicus]|uniref:GRIP domain-containing protein RUD3-like isoform X2 n=1 Tax=Lotus japonicus TaxID=34305 RepID=UPI00258B4B0E|nr:GRIP domain-containing protein RUD3-like isoform X2 [Lotus japonicus]